jgi:hypothetical protein
LDEPPFKSSPSIAERLAAVRSTVLRHLHESLGFKWFHLRWMPHLLNENLRQKQKRHTSGMLPFLYAAQRDGWHHLATNDESWLFFDTLPRRMWTLSRDNGVTKPRQQIESKKFMFTVIWNASGFYAVDRLRNDAKMNSAYFVTNVLIPLEEAIFLQ